MADTMCEDENVKKGEKERKSWKMEGKGEKTIIK